MRAAQSQAQGGQSALAESRRGLSPDDAQDLTQGFFLHVVEHRVFTGVDRLKGKFRSFLLAPTSRTRATAPAGLKGEEARNLYNWAPKRPKNAIDSSRLSF
jgi:hypothetical protein